MINFKKSSNLFFCRISDYHGSCIIYRINSQVLLMIAFNDQDHHSTSVLRTTLFSAAHNDPCVAHTFLENWVPCFNHQVHYVFHKFINDHTVWERPKAFLTSRWMMIPSRPGPELLEISMIGFVL